MTFNSNMKRSFVPPSVITTFVNVEDDHRHLPPHHDQPDQQQEQEQRRRLKITKRRSSSPVYEARDDSSTKKDFSIFSNTPTETESMTMKQVSKRIKTVYPFSSPPLLPPPAQANSSFGHTNVLMMNQPLLSSFNSNNPFTYGMAME